MITIPRTAFLFCSVVCAGCGSTPPAPDADIEAKFAKKHAETDEMLARRQAFDRVLIEADQQLERYAATLMSLGAPKSERQSETLKKHLEYQVNLHFARFVHAAESQDLPRNRAIALAALGLSNRREALDPLLNGLTSDDPEVVGNAVFGLGLLKDPRTPPAYLARVVQNDTYTQQLRGGAAWSLFQIQEAAVDVSQFGELWAKILDGPLEDAVPSVAVSAIRAIGSLRDPAQLGAVKRYAAHPAPKVRQTAAVAIGRLGEASGHTALIPLIGPAEDNPNVRLAARKALQALAGGIDRMYDVEEWQRVFDRG